MAQNIDIARWLEQLGLGEHTAAFAENRIDAETLRELTADDLKELGVVALGDRKKLLKAIAELGAVPELDATRSPPRRDLEYQTGIASINRDPPYHGVHDAPALALRTGRAQTRPGMGRI
jgi:hypothetical protein